VTGRRPLIAVLGASGFVGSAVTAALSRRAVRLRPVARRPAVVPAGARAEVDPRVADLTDPGAMADAVDGADAVIHLVTGAGGWRGADPAGDRINVGLAHDLVTACAYRPGPPPVVVFAGSTSQIGLPPRTPIDGTEPDHPVTPYDRQKLAAENVLKEATARGVIRGTSLRLPTVFGRTAGATAQDSGVVTAMTRRALAGEELTLWTGGDVERDLLAVDDVAAAFVAAVEHGDELRGRHWLLGTGRGVRLDTLFQRIAAAVSAVTARPPVAVRSVPPPEQATVTDQRSVVVDSSAFRTVTGWRPRTSLGEGLRQTVLSAA
jgi:nucleoside-diphosphate-sugar epimerase